MNYNENASVESICGISLDFLEPVTESRQTGDLCPNSEVWTCFLIKIPDSDNQLLEVFNENTEVPYSYPIVDERVIQLDPTGEVVNSWPLTSFISNLNFSAEQLEEPQEIPTSVELANQEILQNQHKESYRSDVSWGPVETLVVVGSCLVLPLSILMAKIYRALSSPTSMASKNSSKKTTNNSTPLISRTTTSLSMLPGWFQRVAEDSRKSHLDWLKGTDERTINDILKRFGKTDVSKGFNISDLDAIPQDCHPKAVEIARNNYQAAIEAAKEASSAAKRGDVEGAQAAMNQSVEMLHDCAMTLEQLRRR